MMRVYLGVLLIGVMSLSAVVLHSDSSLWAQTAATAQEEAKKSDLPPLIIDDDEPLLLLDAAEEEEKSEAEIKALAESQACFVCHVNYQEEPLAVTHSKMGFSCVTCHGTSFPHRNDENNTTPPDRMFPADQIDKFCGECHKTHNAPAIKVIAQWQKLCPDKTDPKTIACTDCHGQHRLKIRSVRWDKKTRKLLPTEPAKQTR